jgi:glycerate 2-kinase
LGAREAAAAIALGARDAGWEAVELPLADGGEGTLEALGGANRHTVVSGPLGDPVEAGWRLDGDDAIVEMALASGLTLAGGRDRNDPLESTTRGTGELIAAALAAGARSVVVGIGGSATTDGGEGALEALVDWLPFPAHGARVQVACDVTTLFVDAACVFAPQKGANPGQVGELEPRA